MASRAPLPRLDAGRKNVLVGIMRWHPPEPPAAGRRILPVFLPFAGCPSRCVFCAQTLQTGRAERALAEAYAETESMLAGLRGETPEEGWELAFYGGTFTALPEAAQEAFLRLGERARREGRIRRMRCSTRPDRVDAAWLERLRGMGLDLVELGVQSFDGGALARSGRGYDGETALAAARAVREAGLALGVQLMPGMPGVGREVFRADIALVRELAPESLRIYPCLVLEGTGLARLWRAGAYAPWTLEESVEEAARACLAVWERGVRVIRLGVKEEPGLAKGCLAGPRHPAFGDMVKGRALFLWLAEKLAGRPGPFALAIPRSLQGVFWGHGGSLREAYRRLGVERVRVHDDAHIACGPA